MGCNGPNGIKVMNLSRSLSIIVMETLWACANAQQPRSEDVPTFEAVSIRPVGHVAIEAGPGERVYFRSLPFRYSGDRVTATETLKHIIQEAYSLDDSGVDGPTWLNDDLYELAAVAPAGTKREAGRLMLRSMLAERFHLKFHDVLRDMTVYALVGGDHGFKLRPLGENTGHPASSCEARSGTFTATGTLDLIASCSRWYMKAPVENVTGIAGVYQMALEWTAPAELDDTADGFQRELLKVAGLKLARISHAPSSKKPLLLA